MSSKVHKIGGKLDRIVLQMNTGSSTVYIKDTVLLQSVLVKLNFSFSIFTITFYLVRVPLIHYNRVSLNTQSIRKIDYTNPVNLRTIRFSNYISYSYLKATEKSLGVYYSSDHYRPSIQVEAPISRMYIPLNKFFDQSNFGHRASLFQLITIRYSSTFNQKPKKLIKKEIGEKRYEATHSIQSSTYYR